MFDFHINISKNDIEFYLMDLKSRFSKINHKKYALAYSGGKDSHRLFHLIKMWGFNDIEIIGVNTFMEHKQIKNRIHKNCNTVLFPKMKPFDIKEKYGSPCFTKFQDEYIKRYQKGLRSKNCLDVVMGKNINRNLNKTARELLLTNKLHKISNRCCDFLKKKPMEKYLKKNNKKVILGVMGAESKIRQTQYKSCFTKSKNFTPCWDLTKEMGNAIDEYLNIDIPNIYKYLSRTGCMGCPYGKKTELELTFLTKSQFNFITQYHKESYEIKKINIKKTNLFNMEDIKDE